MWGNFTRALDGRDWFRAPIAIALWAMLLALGGCGRGADPADGSQVDGRFCAQVRVLNDAVQLRAHDSLAERDKRLSMVEGGFRSLANDYDAIGLGTPAGLVRKTADDVGEYRQGLPPPVSLGLEIDRDIAMVRSVRGIDDSRCRGLVA